MMRLIIKALIYAAGVLFILSGIAHGISDEPVNILVGLAIEVPFIIFGRLLRRKSKRQKRKEEVIVINGQSSGNIITKPKPVKRRKRSSFKYLSTRVPRSV